MKSVKRMNYGEALCAGFEYLLEHYSEAFVIGQGLWSPWYVGSSMKDLDKKFGKERVIDTPVSEDACTGAAVGASLAGMRPIVIHPRIDFMILATNQIVNQAAKWSSMLGGQSSPKVTIRGIVNRGGEQGAQHSQALHAWFGHVPGLRVVMPGSAHDARDLLIASALCDDPVLFIDDRWLYELEDDFSDVVEQDLREVRPRVLRDGKDITMVSISYPISQCAAAAEQLAQEGIDCEVIDLRTLNPLDSNVILSSVAKTKRLCVVDGGTKSFGMTGEIVARVAESFAPSELKSPALRIATPDAPAPTSKPLEEEYYRSIRADGIRKAVIDHLQ